MKFLIKFFFSLVFAGFLFVIVNASPKMVSYSDPNKKILIQQSDPKFAIVQAANPTTGYSWTIISYDKRYLQLVSSNYEKNNPQSIGSGGQMIWIFKAKPAAFKGLKTFPVVPIELRYARPWAPTDHPTTKIFTIYFTN
jgi:inhibitor of cysteine peptidase